MIRKRKKGTNSSGPLVGNSSLYNKVIIRSTSGTHIKNLIKNYKRENNLPEINIIADRFNTLPFSVAYIWQGTFDSVPDTYAKIFFPAIILTLSAVSNKKEQQIQRRFFNGLSLLNIKLADILNVEPYNIFDLQGYIIDVKGNLKPSTLAEAIDTEGIFTLFLHIDEIVHKYNVVKTLISTVWIEFFKYLDRFDQINVPVPVFNHATFSRTTDEATA